MSVGHPSHHMVVPVPVLFLRLGFGMPSTTQSPWGHSLLGLPAPPSVGAGADPSQCSWDCFLLFCRANSNLSNFLYSSLHRVKLEGLMYCLIWIVLVFKAEKKQTLQLLLLLLLPRCHCCINSLFLPLMVNDSPHNEVKVFCQYDQVSETKS